MGLTREFELHPKILLQHFHVTLTATLPLDMINNTNQFSRLLGVLYSLLRLWKETRNTDSDSSLLYDLKLSEMKPSMWQRRARATSIKTKSNLNYIAKVQFVPRGKHTQYRL